ncbi:uncharacterized protein [Procambarus clarkii]|uniref:uncharacterized protein n=1 Tax=Procambarus clarkii TaxID=6728 RepID=UPI003742C81D
MVPRHTNYPVTPRPPSTLTMPVTLTQSTFLHVTQPPRYPTSALPNLRVTQPPRYPTSTLPNLRVTQPPRYPTSALPNLHVTQPSRYPTSTLPNLHVTQPPRYPTSALPNLRVTQPPRYPTTALPNLRITQPPSSHLKRGDCSQHRHKIISRMHSVKFAYLPHNPKHWRVFSLSSSGTSLPRK